MRPNRFALACFLLGLCVALLGVAAPASDVTYQGQLLAADGQPFDGEVDLELRVLADPVSAPQPRLVFAELHPAVRVEEGLFVLRLGDGVPLAGAREDVASGAAVPLSARVLLDGRPLGPDEPLAAAPAADRNAVDPPRPELRIFDGRGRELGMYAGERLVGGDPYLVHRPDVGLTYALRAATGEVGAPDVEVFYERSDCAGQPYVDRRWRGVVFARTEVGFLVGTATATLRPLVVASSRTGPQGACEERAREVVDVAPVTALDAVPFPVPAALPLHVGVVGSGR